MQNPQPRADKYGNEYVLLSAINKTDKKTGEELPIAIASMEIKKPGKFRFEISKRNKEHSSGKGGVWIKIVRVTNRNNQQRNSF